MIHHDLTLCLVTHRKNQTFEAYQRIILRAVEGGVTSVQLRDKHASTTALWDMAFALKSLLAPFNVPLIINDHVDLAKAVGAEGIHLGQSDVCPKHARDVLGDEVCIGLSIETLAQLDDANRLTCLDYVAASAVFPSHTKTNCATIWGIDGLQAFCAQSVHPVIAIGGIECHNVHAVMACGVIGVAVVGAIHQAPCPKQGAQLMKQHII